jgi:hypothetical protein
MKDFGKGAEATTVFEAIQNNRCRALSDISNTH